MDSPKVSNNKEGREEKKEQMEKKSILNNIKSIFVLKKIFKNLNTKISLEIIQNNKTTQKRLGITINDYKEFSQYYSSIEIEITPVPAELGTFINFIEDESYFHIYFDDSEEEIKRNYLERKDRVSKIKVVIDHQLRSFHKLFNDCKCIKIINFKLFLRINIYDMSYMFNNCLNLRKINFFMFNTDNVSNMSNMFYGCISLKELNCSNFNTNKVTDMSWMFLGCSSLKKIDLSNFITNEVTDLSRMFQGCSSLEELNLSNFNTNNVTNMESMFAECSSLKTLNISSFNTDKVRYMNRMFKRCSKLVELDLSNFNTYNVTRFYGMFYECFSLEKLIIPNFDLTESTYNKNLVAMFVGISDKLQKELKAQKTICNEAFTDT